MDSWPKLWMTLTKLTLAGGGHSGPGAILPTFPAALSASHDVVPVARVDSGAPWCQNGEHYRAV